MQNFQPMEQIISKQTFETMAKKLHCQIVQTHKYFLFVRQTIEVM